VFTNEASHRLAAVRASALACRSARRRCLASDDVDDPPGVLASESEGASLAGWHLGHNLGKASY
jgi:hypothetical protein